MQIEQIHLWHISGKFVDTVEDEDGRPSHYEDTFSTSVVASHIEDAFDVWRAALLLERSSSVISCTIRSAQYQGKVFVRKE